MGSKNRSRRLVVDGQTFLRSVRHTHRTLGNGRYEDCCESLVIRLSKARGQLRIAFRQGPGKGVSGGYPMHSGAVATDERLLNLHEPGTARALLDEALAQGWDPHDSSAHEMDGWTLFDAVATRRPA